FYDNVIDANTLTGTLGPASVGGDDGTDGVYAASILLDASPVYDGADNVDINVNRVAFNDPRFGLTPNQAQAAGGVGNVYSPTLTGPFADMLAEMFLMDDVDEYATALSTL